MFYPRYQEWLHRKIIRFFLKLLIILLNFSKVYQEYPLVRHLIFRMMSSEKKRKNKAFQKHSTKLKDIAPEKHSN